MMLNRSVLVFMVLLAWSIYPSESSSEFNRSVCRDASVPNGAGLIVGGETAPRDKWPWLVALFVKADNKFFCAGSLISERFVLTAAHCIQKKGNTQPRDPKDVNVYFGKWSLIDATEQDVVMATPTEFIVHHDWNVTDTRWDADIAIAKLADNVTFSRSVQPVCLWTSQMQPDEANNGGIVVGWTKTKEDGQHSHVLREAKVLGFPIDCYEADGLSQVISQRGLCIGRNEKGPCTSDDGDGFFTAQGGKWFLRGITSVSRLNSHLECDARAIFTNVEEFVPWIDQVLDGDGGMECEFMNRNNQYTCNLQNSFTRRDTKIFQVKGSHIRQRINAKVRRLESWNNKELKFLPIALGRFFPVMKTYLVADSGLEEISRNNFEDLPILNLIQITGNPLKVVSVDAFYDLFDLAKLWLQSNQIEAIDSATFIHNTNLREIDLSRNKITSWDPSTFMHNTHLKSIDLSRNKITSLDSSTFKHNYRLEELNFSDNLLTSIGSELLAPLRSIQKLDFGRNTCIDEEWDIYEFADMEDTDFKAIFASNCQ